MKIEFNVDDKIITTILKRIVNTITATNIGIILINKRDNITPNKILIIEISVKISPAPKLMMIVSPQVFLIILADCLKESLIEVFPKISEGKLKKVSMLQAAPNTAAIILPRVFDLSDIF